MMQEVVSQRRQVLSVNIRRQQKENYFKKEREILKISMEVSSVFEQFIWKKMEVVPDICVQNTQYIKTQSMQPFLHLIMNNQLQLLQPQESVNTWYFDCTHPQNLKLITNIIQNYSSDHLFGNYFYSTIEHYRPYYTLFLTLKNSVQQQNCLIMQGSITQTLKHLQQHFMQQKLASVLGFWSTYLRKSQDNIMLEAFKTLLGMFSMFCEFSDIISFRQCYSFIRTTIDYIIKMKILQMSAKGMIALIPLAESCHKFIQGVKLRLPSMIDRVVNFDLNFPELAEALEKYHDIDKYISNNFYQTIFLCNLFKVYLIKLLQGSAQNSKRGRISALKLINLLIYHGNIHQLFYLDGLLSIVQIMTQVLLMHPQYKHIITVILYNLLEDDQDSKLVLVFESISYTEYLKVPDQYTPDYFELIVKILGTYKDNKTINHKLFIECELQESMYLYYRGIQNQKGYKLLAHYVENNIDFYATVDPCMLENMVNHLGNMTFQGVDQLEKKMVQEIWLIKNQNRLREERRRL